MVLEEPRSFYKSAKKEKLLSESLIYFALLSLIGSVFSVIYSLIFYPTLSKIASNLFPPAPSVGFIEILPYAVTSYAVALVLSFVWAGVLYLWLSLFKAKGTYKDAFRLYVYSRTPNFLFGWIPFVSIAAWIYGLYLLIVGTEVMYSVPRRKAMLLFVAPLVLFVVLFAILGYFYGTGRVNG